jgi:formylglycine-generating enzyme required for sulfatase activity
VVQVSWDDAKAFCDWAGLVLPSEEQWEKAARGADGRRWPWGNEPPTDRHCNFNMNVKDTTPVGRYSPLGDSPFGCADMAGNVWEWTGSWFDTQQTRRVVRGGSWYDVSDQRARGLSLLRSVRTTVTAGSVSGWCAGPHLRRSELCRRASGSGARLA